MNTKEQGLGVGHGRFRIGARRRQDRRFFDDQGTRNRDERRNLMDCFLSERSHEHAENKGDAKKRTQNEAIRAVILATSD